jgi:hypothetical protein
MSDCHSKKCVLSLQIETKAKDSILDSLSSSYKDQMGKNRHILSKIIETLVLCGKQNILIRGHTDDRSNFMAILCDKSKKDLVLSEHLANTTAKYKYTSPDIQNELIYLCAKQIKDSIASECSKSPFFAIIADEATDKSTKEQLSMCLRFVNAMSTVRKEFVGFVHAESVKGQEIARLILSAFNDMDLDITQLRARCYDGASNMSGKLNGVQAIIRQPAPEANYVHCKAHSLNLALVHSSKESCVRTMMATVQEIGFAFDYSAKRLNAFSKELSNDVETREQLERRSKLITR